jgi:hypothetical protein
VRCRLAKNSVCQPASPQRMSAFTGGSAIGVVVVGVGGVIVVVAGVVDGVVAGVGGVVIGTGVGGSV